MAMRAMSEGPAAASVDEDLPNVLYSPSGSATTGLSGGSSLGLQYKGAWCTPPRVFVDYQVLGLKFIFICLFIDCTKNKFYYLVAYTCTIEKSFNTMKTFDTLCCTDYSCDSATAIT